MSKTRLLDAMLETLRDKATAKRAPRKGIQIDVYMSKGQYTIQCNGKTLEEGAGDEEYAVGRASERAKKMQELTGKPCVVSLY